MQSQHDKNKLIFIQSYKPHPYSLINAIQVIRVTYIELESIQMSNLSRIRAD